MNIYTKEFATFICMLGAAMSLSAGLQEALEAQNNGDGEKAVMEFSKLAAKGDIRAMNTIGCMYLNGDGIQADYSKAQQWFLTALATGDADAMNNIGVMYRDALGVKQDLELAYALFQEAIRVARNDDAYGLAVRNTEKILQYITADQLNRAKKLKPKDLTADKIRSHTSSPGALRRDIDLLPTGWQKGLKTVVQERSVDGLGHASAQVLCLRNDEYSDMPGTLGFSTVLEKKPENYIKENVYSNSESRILIDIPFFSTGKITLHQSKLPGSDVFMLRISEGKVFELEPWVVGDDLWHGVVITTLLPESWATRGSEAFERVVEMQKNHVSQVSENNAAVTILSSPQGKKCQTVVLNQAITPLYPQAEARVRPLSEGLKTIGISRMMYRDNVIVHLALIVFRPMNMDNADFLNYSTEQMDDFEGRFQLMPLTLPK